MALTLETEDDSLAVVLDRMLRHNITRIPVVCSRVPVGIVARHDLLSLVAQNKDLLRETETN